MSELERGDPLAVDEGCSLGVFLDEMRETVENTNADLFGSDPRLAAISATFVSDANIEMQPSFEASWYDQEDYKHGMGLYQRKTSEFADRNALDSSDIMNQWEVVEEEVEEMFEVFEEFSDLPIGNGEEESETRESLAEEMADAIFTIHLLANLIGIDLREEFREKADYNLEKSGQRDPATGKILDDVGGDPDG